MCLDQCATYRNKHVAGFSISVSLLALCNSVEIVDFDNCREWLCRQSDLGRKDFKAGERTIHTANRSETSLNGSFGISFAGIARCRVSVYASGQAMPVFKPI